MNIYHEMDLTGIKDYLSQAYHIDLRINSKLEQVCSLNALAEKCTATLTGMPRGSGGSVSAMADTVDKIIDLQAEINTDIDELVNIKRELSQAIRSLESMEARTLLEMRYLCFMQWEQITVEMGYTKRYLHTLHNESLKKLLKTRNCALNSIT